MGLSSTIIYTSELILCSTICVPSATRHNIHMYPYFLFVAIHHLKSSPNFSVRPCSSVGRVTVDLIRRLWVRFPPRSKDFFFAPCGSLFPFTRANAQWVIREFTKPRRQRQRERHRTKDFKARTMAVHVRFNSWYISLTSSAKQQREMTKSCVVWRT